MAKQRPKDLRLLHQPLGGGLMLFPQGFRAVFVNLCCTVING